MRLIVHLPVEDSARLAHWSLMMVVEGGQVPQGEVLDQGNIPVSGANPPYEEILTMIDGIVGPRLLA